MRNVMDYNLNDILHKLNDIEEKLDKISSTLNNNEEDYNEPAGIDDDNGEWLSSAGMGTDEDYGG